MKSQWLSFTLSIIRRRYFWIPICCLLPYCFIGCERSTSISSEPDYINESIELRDARMKWWRDARLGMFIHWGPYSQLSGIYNEKQISGIGDWIMERAAIPVSEYEQYARQLNPDNYQADDWVRLAKESGLKYIIFTAKHHDGFCLWNSAYTDYDITDFTTFKKDMVQELAEACQKYGLKFGLYYSIMDWHHPNAQSVFYPDYNDLDTTNANFGQYVEDYMKPQIRELLTAYDPDIFWFDGEWIKDWTHSEGIELYQMIRSIKPSIIINNRIDKGRNGTQGMNKKDQVYAGDFGTPEQEILEGHSFEYWETCMSINDTWGYKSFDNNWKSAETLIYQLVETVAKGGNYLLNIGPKPDGSIPAESKNRLAAIGKWLSQNGEAIYTSKSYPYFKEREYTYFTRDTSETTVYALNLGTLPDKLTLSDVTPKKGSTIQLLGDSRELDYEINKSGKLIISIPTDVLKSALQAPIRAYTIRIKGKRIIADSLDLQISNITTLPNSD